MRLFILTFFLLINFQAHTKECSPLLDFNIRTLNDNEVVNLCEKYQGKVLLVVNTASRCAYTDQYDSLEKLYSQYRNDGLVVLGFPSNDFGNQEPGTEKEIQAFCRLTYAVDFPMFSKTRVTEQNADPFYKKLGEVSGVYPRWNFHKYLIGRDGELVANYRSNIDPLDKRLVKAIDMQLQR